MIHGLITTQKYMVFHTKTNLKQHKTCLKRYNFKLFL